jgi:hypothetical protein
MVMAAREGNKCRNEIDRGANDQHDNDKQPM